MTIRELIDELEKHPPGLQVKADVDPIGDQGRIRIRTGKGDQLYGDDPRKTYLFIQVG